jgi:hypothetical protein
MVISRSRIARRLGWACFFLFPNHDLFNFLFSGSLFVIWKQALSAALIGLSLHWAIKSTEGGPAERIKRRLIIYLSIAGIFFVVYSSLIGISILRSSYGLLSYIGLLGFLYFSSLISRDQDRYTLYKIAAIISAICSVGLILDFSSSIFSFLPRSIDFSDEYIERHEIFKRVSFLFGASTIVAQFQAFGLMAAALTYSRHKSTVRFSTFLFTALLIVSSSFLTGSRTAFFSLMVFFVILFVLVTKGSIGSIHRILTIIGVMIIALANVDIPYVSIAVENWDRYSSVFSSIDAGNEGRFARWQQGFSLMTNVSPEWFLGNGLGTTLGMISDGSTTSTHFESSVFQAFFEGGFGLILVRYLTSLVAIFIFFTRSKQRTIEEWALLFFLFLHFASTATAPTFGAYHIQMVYFLASGLLISLSLKKVSTSK